MAFVANAGQLPEEARFTAQSGELTAWFTPGGARFSLAAADGRRAALFLEFAGRDAPGSGEAPATCPPRGEGAPRGRVHAYRGTDRARWVEHAPTFDGLRYAGVAPGVDLLFLERDGRLAYDLVLAPGARAGDLRLRCRGASGLALDEQGHLVVETSAGPLVHSVPVAWEECDGARQPVAARFVLRGADGFGFEVERRDETATLVIDPGLTWGSHLGGGLADRATAVGVTAGGLLVVAGTTGSPDFPVTPGAQQEDVAGFNDAFVAAIDPQAGDLVFATYLGGHDTVIFRPDVAEALALADDGSLVVAGTSASPDFPTTGGAWQPTSTGGTDAFAARLLADGTLAWSTLLGGSGNDEAAALALSPDGRVTLAGLTFSSSFPTTPGAFDRSFNSLAFTDDGFVARLSADGASLLWSTFVGGPLRDELRAVALDGADRPVVAGLSGSVGFPTTVGAYDTSFNGAGPTETDAIVARLAADGSALQWSTFFGAPGLVEGNGLALDGDGSVVLVGEVRGAGLPVTSGALQPGYGGGMRDGFVARLSAGGNTLQWSTYLGGAGDDMLSAVAVAAGGQATVAGTSSSPGLVKALLPDALTPAGALSATGVALAGGVAPAPIAPASAFVEPLGTDLTLDGGSDALLVRLTVDGERVVWAGFHGGSAGESGVALALEEGGAVWLAGASDSADLPVAGAAVQPTAQGALDAYAARFAVPPVTVLLAGDGATGPRLSARGAFERARPWEVTVDGLAPGSLAWLVVGAPSPGVLAGGVLLRAWPVAALVPLSAGGEGRCVLGGARWPLPPGSALALQVVVPGAGPGAALAIHTP